MRPQHTPVRSSLGQPGQDSEYRRSHQVGHHSGDHDLAHRLQSLAEAETTHSSQRPATENRQRRKAAANRRLSGLHRRSERSRPPVASSVINRKDRDL